MKSKISITLDEHLIRFVDSRRGDVARSKFIENYLKSKVNLFEALWIFADEIPKAGFSERWLSAHTSQPFGKPLHKHEGLVSVEGGAIIFHDSSLNEQFSVKKKDIRSLKVAYDGTFRRVKDSRGLVPPLQFSFGKSKIYMFLKTNGRNPLVRYAGYNQKFLDALGIKPKKVQMTEFVRRK